MIHPLYQTSLSETEGLQVDLEPWNFLSFVDFPQLRLKGGFLLLLEVQSFPPPSLRWWQDFNNYSTFGLHCAAGPVRSSSSVASEEPSTSQDVQDFLWLF